MTEVKHKKNRPLAALDVLDDAMARLAFLQEILPSASHEGMELQLSEFATCGLSAIIIDINTKISNVRESIDY